MKIPFSVEELENHIQRKTVRKVKHPTEALWILNYTPQLQKLWEWDNVTMHCRGLIVDKDYNVIARPFSKFFSVEQLGDDWIPPEGSIEITRKADGSLGILYWIKNIPYIATRGSFSSEQALKGTDMLHNRMRSPDQFHKGITYLFEIIYPENKIVVDYKAKEDLILLAKINTETGMEIPLWGEWNSIITKFPVLTFQKALTMNEINEEGFVCRFLKTGQRVKIKNEWYKKIDFLLRFVTTKRILGALKEKKVVDYFTIIGSEKTPEWIYQIFWEKYNDLTMQFKEIEQKHFHLLSIIKQELENNYTRKEIAQEICTEQNHAILFAMLDGKDYSKYIWKLVEKRVKEENI